MKDEKTKMEKEEKKKLKQEKKEEKKAKRRKMDKMELSKKIIASMMAIIMIVGMGTTFVYYILRMMR